MKYSFLKGGDLDQKIIECSKGKNSLDEKLIMNWFVQLLLAVHYMHQRRILHRDLKTRYSICTIMKFIFMPQPKSWKVCQGHLVIGSSVHFSICL